MRKEIWGYSADESLSTEDMIAETYKMVCPAPGYPACPDHLEKPTIWKLLNVEEEIGVVLTESMRCGQPLQYQDIILEIQKVSILDLENKRRSGN